MTRQEIELAAIRAIRVEFNGADITSKVYGTVIVDSQMNANVSISTRPGIEFVLGPTSVLPDSREPALHPDQSTIHDYIAPSEEAHCDDISPDGLSCFLYAGHDGLHYGDKNGVLSDMWPNPQPPPSP